MKNKCKSCGRSKTFTVVILFLFEGESNAFSSRNKLDRLAIVSRSSYVGVWGRSPQLPEENGISGAEPPSPPMLT